MRNFCYLIDWRTESKCRIEWIDNDSKSERFEWLEWKFDRWFNRIVFSRVCQRCLDAYIFINMIDVCSDEIFWFSLIWCFIDRSLLILRSFCCSIDWKVNSRCRTKTIDESIEFEWFERLINKFEIINDFDLIKHRKKRKAHFLSYCIQISSELFFREHSCVTSMHEKWKNDKITNVTRQSNRYSTLTSRIFQFANACN